MEESYEYRNGSLPGPALVGAVHRGLVEVDAVAAVGDHVPAHLGGDGVEVGIGLDDDALGDGGAGGQQIRSGLDPHLALDGHAGEHAGIARGDHQVPGDGDVGGVAVAVGGQRRGGGTGAEREPSGGEGHGGHGDDGSGEGAHGELLGRRARLRAAARWGM